MKLIFLEGANGQVVPINPEIIGHIDEFVENGIKVLNECQIFTTNGLRLRMKGGPKEVGHLINKQTEGLHLL